MEINLENSKISSNQVADLTRNKLQNFVLKNNILVRVVQRYLRLAKYPATCNKKNKKILALSNQSLFAYKYGLYVFS